MTKILTKLPKPDADGRRDLAPLIVVNGYEVHPVLFNAMLSDADRGRSLLASIAESGAIGVGCDISADTVCGIAVRRLFAASNRLLDTLNEPDELAVVAAAVIRESCTIIFG